MTVQYNRLLKLLIDRKMTTGQLATKAGLSANIIVRIKNDQFIKLETVGKICSTLNCGVDDILEFVPDEHQE